MPEPKWYHIALWVGGGGEGKTTGMIRYLIKHLDAGVRYTHAYGNIEVRHPKYQKIKYEELKDLRADTKDGKPTALLCLDQIHKYLDARQSNSARNKYMGDIVIESRQHGFDLRGTTWGKSSVDPRTRKFVELLVFCERYNNGFQYTDLDAVESVYHAPVRLSYQNARQWWNYFNNDELVEDIDPRYDPRFSMKPVAP